nr:lysine/arginine/ornithine ABC transporter substrate-binding protein [Aureimonas sp. AU40]
MLSCRFPLLAAMTALLASTVAAPAQTKPTTVTIATEGAYEPWNFTAADGTLQGFEVDLAADLCKRMEVTCTVVAQDWDGLIPSLNAHKFDAIMASMIVTDKRKQAISFSEPYAPTAAAFMVEKGGALAGLPGTGTSVDLAADPAKVESELKPLRAALEGKSIGAQSSTANVAFLEKYLKGAVEVREYKTVEQHNLDLAAGRIDGVVAQKTSLDAMLGKPDFAGYEIAGPTFEGDVFGQGIAVGLRRDDAALKAEFDKAITAAKADGTIDKLSDKWFKATAK